MIKKWRSEGPKPLNNGGWDIHGKPLEYPNANEYNSGLYLFTDRNTITHFFKPNFLPPYDTKAKREIILDYLKESWDEKSLTWQPVKSIVETALERLKVRQESRNNESSGNGKKDEEDNVANSDASGFGTVGKGDNNKEEINHMNDDNDDDTQQDKYSAQKR